MSAGCPHPFEHRCILVVVRKLSISKTNCTLDVICLGDICLTILSVSISLLIHTFHVDSCLCGCHNGPSNGTYCIGTVSSIIVRTLSARNRRTDCVILRICLHLPIWHHRGYEKRRLRANDAAIPLATCQSMGIFARISIIVQNDSISRSESKLPHLNCSLLTSASWRRCDGVWWSK